MYLLRQIESLVDIKGIVWETGSKRGKLRQLYRRAKKLGYLYPISRIFLHLFVKFFQKKHKIKCFEWNSIQSASSLEQQEYMQYTVSSINEKCVQDLLMNVSHDLVIVGGTSIIKKHILDAGRCFVNIHAGITPEYRGAHGGVWAVINQDYENAGVTLHFIDEGIDTGGIISQKAIQLSPMDTMQTISAKQKVCGVQLLKDFFLKNSPPFSKTIAFNKRGSESKLYYSPTLREYQIFLRNIRLIRSTNN